MLDSVFEELAHGCKMGDSQAMLRMYQWFWSRVPDELKRLDSQYAARCSERKVKRSWRSGWNKTRRRVFG